MKDLSLVDIRFFLLYNPFHRRAFFSKAPQREVLT
jgi:hypothetical protein